LTLVSNVTFPDSVNGHSTWVGTPTRRLKLFDQVDSSIQPTMFMVQHREGYSNRGVGLPPRRWLEVGLWCYARSGSDTDVGDLYLDSMEEAIENKLNVPDDLMRNELTLGGLCYWVKINRESNLFIRDPGDIDGQALLILPIEILLP